MSGSFTRLPPVPAQSDRQVPDVYQFDTPTPSPLCTAYPPPYAPGSPETCNLTRPTPYNNLEKTSCETVLLATYI